MEAGRIPAVGEEWGNDSGQFYGQGSDLQGVGLQIFVFGFGFCGLKKFGQNKEIINLAKVGLAIVSHDLAPSVPNVGTRSLLGNADPSSLQTSQVDGGVVLSRASTRRFTGDFDTKSLDNMPAVEPQSPESGEVEDDVATSGSRFHHQSV